MPYIGKSPLHGNYQKLDSVSSSFDGSTTQFALTTNSLAVTPVTEAALLISMNGVLQEPTTAYTVSGTNITFTSAPASTDTFYGVVLGEQLAIGTPSDSTVTSAKLASTFFTGATDIGAAIVDADLFLMDDGAGGTLRKTTASRLKTYIGGSDPASADGDSLGTASLEWSDLYLADGGVIYFGNDQDVTITHDPDDGLFLKSTATSDDNPVLLTLQTGETDIGLNDVIGKISFQAPDEGTGTDAILVSAAIQAVAEGDHSSSSNATTLQFMTGASEAAATKWSITSAGTFLNAGTNIIDMNAGKIDLDADADTSIVASTDDEIHFEIGAATEMVKFAHGIYTFKGLDTGAAHDPQMILFRDSSSPADGDIIGNLIYDADNDAGQQTTFANIRAEIVDASDGTEDGRLRIYTMKDGTATESLKVEKGHVLTPANPSFYAWKSATQTFNSGSPVTEVTWSSERHDIGANFDTSGERFTAPVAGIYLFTLTAQFNNMGTTDASRLSAYLYKNGSGPHDDLFRLTNASGVSFDDNFSEVSFSSSVIESASADDYYEIFVYHTTGSNNTALNYTQGYGSFSGVLIG